MTIEHQSDPCSRDEVYVVRFDPREALSFGAQIQARIMEMVAQRVAAQYLERHGTEVLAKLSAEAIATMAVAEAGAAVHETLQKKLPDKILEVVRAADPIVLQRGIFGGVTRLR